MGLLDVFKRAEKPRRRMSFARRAIRAFSGADTGRLFSKWTSVPESPDALIKESLQTLRARSRDQYINNDYVRRYVAMVRDNVAGPSGIALQAAVKSQTSGKPDYLANQAIEAAWQEWGRPENCDFLGAMSWKEMQWQALASAAIDGEILAVTYSGKPYGKYFFQVQHVDAEMLDPSYSDDLSGGRKIRMGVEYDASGRPAYYHLLSADPTSYVGKNGKRYIKLPASRVIHAFRREQVGQSRGYPWVSTALGSLKHLDAYREAAVTAARAGASKMGFITTQDGASFTGDGEDADGALLSDFEAGVIEQLPDGYGFTAFDPRYPHEQFGEFCKSVLQSISMSLGVSYSGLSGDLEGVNYSSIRAGVLEEREAWKALQEWFIESYCRPIYERWLHSAYMAGAIKIGGTPLVKDEEVYRNVSWQGRRWSWVDPQKDATAKIQEIDNNITTVSAVIREQGKDPEDVFQERAKEKARLAELGLSQAEVVSNV